jgi:transposase InsO family protein
MTWQVCTVVDRRRELVEALRAGEPVARVSRRLGVSRTTAYKWGSRYKSEGEAGLVERSRRPRTSPRQTPAAIEAQVCQLRRQNPYWGGRKLHHRLRALGVQDVPSPSAITDILARNGLLDPERRLLRDWQRFEAEQPNQMWQMDFKGDFPLGQGRCYPLTVVDDHSRFNLCLKACDNQRGDTVQSHLIPVFATYGLPETILVDNGPPWGSAYSRQPHTHHSAWLMRLGIYVSHGRPFHPQTRGKDERFHRSLKLEVLRDGAWQSLEQLQQDLDRWQQVYNQERPHQALAYAVPASRYTSSPRPLPSQLSAIEYPASDQVRRVQDHGEISFQGRIFKVGRAFTGEPVGLRESEEDAVWDVYYCKQRVGQADFRTPASSRQDL